MGVQTTFKRYEIKYLLTKREKERIISLLNEYMTPDEYGNTTIRNIYFDTANFRLIRHSLEKPVYKEKLRIRSYKRIGENDPAFVELKKKYQSVVYKRRLILPQKTALDCLCKKEPLPVDSQIAREIDYFCQYYGDLRPAVFLSYEREAYFDKVRKDFRVTFDENIIYREHDLSLNSAIYGEPLLGEEQVLMEVKTAGGIPLWLTGLLTEQQIFKTSFSKYGTAYRDIMSIKAKGGFCHAG